MNRNHVVFNHLGEQIVPIYKKDVTWEEVRERRNRELKNSDWRFMSDQSPSQEWVDYRLFLRDLPQQFTEANDAVDAWNEYDIPE